MKKLIVHVGPHKTGSTYIQRMLHDNREVLLKCGVSYPSAYYLYFGHHFLLNALNHFESDEKIRQTIIEQTSSMDLVILSSENFINLAENGLKKLKSCFPEVEIKFILFLRRPSIRLVSWWQETIKQGDVHSLDDFMIRHCLHPAKSREVSHFDYIDNVKKIFGEKSIALIDYETAVKTKSVMSFFWKAVGIQNIIQDLDKEVNRMMDLNEIELIRYLNIRAKQDGLLNSLNVRELYMRLREQLLVDVEAFVLCLKKNTKSLTVGNCAMDYYVSTKVRNSYSEYLVNEPSMLEIKNYILPDTHWMFNSEALAIAQKIYSHIKLQLSR